MKKKSKRGSIKKEKAKEQAGAQQKKQERTKDKQKLFLEAYERTACNISHACKSVNLGRTTFYSWVEKYPAFKAAINEINESFIEIVESQLKKNIMNGKEASLFFFLVNRKPERWRSITKVQMEHSGHIDTAPNPASVLNKVDKKSGRKIGEIIVEAFSESESTDKK